MNQQETVTAQEPTCEKEVKKFNFRRDDADVAVVRVPIVDSTAITQAVAKETFGFHMPFNLIAKIPPNELQNGVVNCRFRYAVHPTSVNEFLYGNRVLFTVNGTGRNTTTFELGIPAIVSLRDYLDGLVKAITPVADEATRTLEEEEQARLL